MPANNTKRTQNVLITGIGGLVGSESAKFFYERGFKIFGIDNDMRRVFFGSEASTSNNIKELKRYLKGCKHYGFDIRNRNKVFNLFKSFDFDLVIHAAAQPSHDWACKNTAIDFEINAEATLYLLEALRLYRPSAVFVFISTNKVYGDNPNRLKFNEEQTRYELDKSDPFYIGIDESMQIDQCMHSLFGVSKCAADLLVQEYGRYFKLKTVSLRCGCIAGSAQAGTQMHGFLSYLGKSISSGIPYKIFGYKGKQVRDNIHASDLARAIYNFFLSPKCGEVYNMGGGRYSNISLIEAIKKFETVLNKRANLEFSQETRLGDHIWYISDVTKFKNDYPEWNYSYDIDAIIKDISTQTR